MRILYVTQNYLPEIGAGPGRVSEMARAWVAAGHEVEVLAPVPNHPAGVVPPAFRGKPVFRETDAYGVEVTRTWLYIAPNKGKVRRSLKFASFAAIATMFGAAIVKRPDVVIGSSPQLLAAVSGGAIASLRRIPFVFEVRDLWPESIVAVGALPAGHPVIRGLEQVEKAMYALATKIVLVTDTSKQRLIERGIPAHKLEVVKNGVDLGKYVPGDRDTALRRELGLGDSFVVGYVGTHGMAHGLDAVLDVAKRLPALRFVFVGDGAERERLAKRVEDERIANVKVLGPLARERMPEVYATLDACIVPLRKTELFKAVIPSKIFEILAMERPIVISVDGEARALVEQSGGGIFTPPEDVAAMTDALSRLAGDRALGRELGRRGREFVIREFDRTQLAARYLEILRATVR